MKLHFEPDLDFQRQAIDAVCDLFRGQEVCRTEFTVTRDAGGAQWPLAFADDDLGIGNRLSLPDADILDNLQAIQLRNGLPPSDTLDSGDFTVEMETGTGKTYVYLRTILELNKRYGFSKFVVVVPSVAIKEGVYKSLQTLKAPAACGGGRRSSRTATTSNTPPGAPSIATAALARFALNGATSSSSCACPAASTTCASETPGATWSDSPCSAK